MQNLKFKSVCGVVALVCLVSTNIAWSEGGSKRGFFDSFVNFFTPSGSVQGEGPIFDELKGVETQIDKIEVQYSRERRPGNKTRYRKQLDSLRNVRDSLITVIEKMPSGVNVAQSSAALSSAAQSSSSVLLNTAGSSASKPISSAAVPASSAANVVCSRDTVFVHDTLVVRDTVVIHDTLYVVLANKPEATPKASPSKSKKKADKASEK
ncbi:MULTISPECIES: hypothetical protein [Fibrobacter]|jgi:hypothetical protein|uniref:Uncharacterized protein n=1 Tax=Fibrobacter succinogenes TaxID=833 RepID=A0A380RU23_FIBSU|nr:hypothetical protein [Fibrobacter succinogenes]PWJ36552.1 hypothetical protein IE02_0021 [Fibrobacter succinogenes subsp. elongatus]SUQ18801.1 hypothetical protein SAMN05661053_0021 [Fibrobacter succinogenes]